MNLAELDDARRRELLARATKISIARNAAVYRAGDLADRVCFVAAGRIKIVRTHISGAESIVGIRTTGDIFGERSALAPGGIRTTSAIAIEPSVIDTLRASEVIHTLERDAAFARVFAGGLTRRLTEAERELTELAGKSVAGRLVDALGRLAAAYGEENDDGSVRIGINLTHRDLADLIGTSRETLSKELSVLADVGLLRVTHKTITLLTPQAFPFARRR